MSARSNENPNRIKSKSIEEDIFDSICKNQLLQVKFFKKVFIFKAFKFGSEFCSKGFLVKDSRWKHSFYGCCKNRKY